MKNITWLREKNVKLILSVNKSMYYDISLYPKICVDVIIRGF